MKSDLISNPLTPAIPTSVIIKLVSSEPGVDKTGAFTTCNPATVNVLGFPPIGPVIPTVPYYGASPIVRPGDPGANRLVPAGMLAWGATLEPSGTAGTYTPTSVPFLGPTLNLVSELPALAATCGFIQGDGSGFGICNSCQTGALADSK